LGREPRLTFFVPLDLALELFDLLTFAGLLAFVLLFLEVAFDTCRDRFLLLLTRRDRVDLLRLDLDLDDTNFLLESERRPELASRLFPLRLLEPERRVLPLSFELRFEMALVVGLKASSSPELYLRRLLGELFASEFPPAFNSAQGFRGASSPSSFG